MTPILHFDFAAADGEIAPLSFVEPFEIVCAAAMDEVIPALRRVQSAVDAGSWAAGYVAYEAAPAFEPAMETPPAAALPLVWFGLYRDSGPDSTDRASNGSYEIGDWSFHVDKARFQEQVADIRNDIAAGEFYQVNHTVRLHSTFTGDASAWYRRLRQSQRAACTACLDLGRFQIVSLSPELFFRMEASDAGTIVTRPMKGTRARGRYPLEDRESEDALRNSEKDRAENLMIVDLVRNDLGRIAETGTVSVDEMFRVERYPTLFQMTSTVSARLRPETGLPEIFSALFPCGSVTGAPKIAAMRRIASLETEPRGVYCGAIGYLAPTGAMTFNVAIRTAVIDTDTDVVEYGVGSGITWDSAPEAEYAENRLKSAILVREPIVPDLFETMRLQEGIYLQPEGHVARILASADYFDVRTDADELRRSLSRLAQQQRSGLWRVRLRLSADGAIRTECDPLDESPAGGGTFAPAGESVDRHDIRLFHKLADRSRYIRCKAERPDVSDVLLRNREGEITEFTTGNLVLEVGGERLTPPIDCGLLPGTLRAELVESGAIHERVVRFEDLERASRFWLINSLRGWVPMEWRR